VSAQFYESCARVFRGLRRRLGEIGLLLPFVLVVGAAGTLVVALRFLNPGIAAGNFHLWQSLWVLLWAIYGGLTMVLLVNAALDHLPWRGHSARSQPLWLYLIPLTLFVVSASPYVGLRTEASIAMFSNLHTEGGQTNHLVITQPPTLFGYQQDVAMIRAASDPNIQRLAETDRGLVLFSLQEYLRRHPDQWVSYDLHGTRHDHVTAAQVSAQAAWWERTFLIFKPVSFERPKVCTH
jgi:hypothetical protein